MAPDPTEPQESSAGAEEAPTRGGGRVVPTLHVRDGDLVARRGRDWAPLDLERLRVPGIPIHGRGRDALLSLAQGLAKAWGDVCVVDLDGLERNDPDLDLAGALDARRVAAWWDAGPRNLGDAMDVLLSGPAKATLRWGRMRGEVIAEAVALADTPIVVGLEAKRGRFVAPARETPDSLLTHAVHASGVVVVDLDAAGSASGFHAPLLDAARDLRHPVWVAGGVASVAEVDALVARGARGALVSTSLLAGGFA